MVRVIEAPPVKQTTCRTCRAKLEYSHSDIKEEFHRDYGGGGDTVYSLTCPNCQSTTYVNRW